MNDCRRMDREPFHTKGLKVTFSFRRFECGLASGKSKLRVRGSRSRAAGAPRKRRSMTICRVAGRSTADRDARMMRSFIWQMHLRERRKLIWFANDITRPESDDSEFG